MIVIISITLHRPKETAFIKVTSDNRISKVLFDSFKKTEDSKTKIKSLKGKYEFKSLLPQYPHTNSPN